jgi:competence protein ComEC
MWNTSLAFRLRRRLTQIPPLYFLSLSFGVGIWISRDLSIYFVSLVLITLFVLLATWFHVRRPLFPVLSAATFFLIGALFGFNHRILPEGHIAMVGRAGAMVIEGVVGTAPDRKVKGKKETVSFVLEVENFYRNGSVHQTEGKVQVFLLNADREILYGDRLRIRGMLEDPKQTRNPNAFNYALYLARQGVFKTFRAIGPASIRQQEPGQKSRFFVGLNKLRIHLRTRLEDVLSVSSRSIASALLIGFRKGIPQEVREDFVRSGTAHLLAISGLHVSLVGGLFFLMGRTVRLPRALNLLMTTFVMLSYTVLAGMKLPVLRAGIMGTVILLGLLLGQEKNVRSAFFFSFFILLLWAPDVLFGASFQLSFIAVAALIFLLPAIRRLVVPNHAAASQRKPPGPWVAVCFHWCRRAIREATLASASVMLGLFPILILYFNLFSVIGFVGNIVVVPIAMFGMAATFILLVVDAVWTPAAHAMAIIPNVIFEIQLLIVHALARVPFGHLYLPTPPWYFVSIYYVLLLAWSGSLARPVPSWVRSALLFSFVGVTILFLILLPTHRPRLVFFDLGRTNSAFISFSNRANCLINTGRRFPSDQAYWTLRPFFLGAGLHKLDSILITKLNARHAGGFRSLVSHVKFQHVWLPKNVRERQDLHKYGFSRYLKQGQVRSLGLGDLLEFGSGREHRAEIIASNGQEILAILFEDPSMRLVYFASARPESFDQLADQVHDKVNFVFLPHVEGRLAERAKSILRQLDPDYIVSSQRNVTFEFKDELESSTDARLLMIEELGAIELSHSRQGWGYEGHAKPHLTHGPDAFPRFV